MFGWSKKKEEPKPLEIRHAFEERLHVFDVIAGGADQIIRNFGALIARAPISCAVADVAELGPRSGRTFILEAIVWAIARDATTDQHFSLMDGAWRLCMFQPGVGPKRIRLLEDMDAYLRFEPALVRDQAIAKRRIKYALSVRNDNARLVWPGEPH